MDCRWYCWFCWQANDELLVMRADEPQNNRKNSTTCFVIVLFVMMISTSQWNFGTTLSFLLFEGLKWSHIYRNDVHNLLGNCRMWKSSRVLVTGFSVGWVNFAFLIRGHSGAFISCYQAASSLLTVFPLSHLYYSNNLYFYLAKIFDQRYFYHVPILGYILDNSWQNLHDGHLLERVTYHPNSPKVHMRAFPVRRCWRLGCCTPRIPETQHLLLVV